MIKSKDTLKTMLTDEERVDAFLRSKALEVEDNGFTERVMRRLPRHSPLQRRLSILWNSVCLTALLVICWMTNVLDMLVTDLHVFVDTLPTVIDTQHLLWLVLVPLLVIWTGAAVLGHKTLLQ